MGRNDLFKVLEYDTSFVLMLGWAIRRENQWANFVTFTASIDVVYIGKFTEARADTDDKLKRNEEIICPFFIDLFILHHNCFFFFFAFGCCSFAEAKSNICSKHSGI